MKKRFVAFALLISAVVVSVSSGCVVRDGYGRGYHHDRYHYRDHDDHGRGHDHDYNQGGYNHY
ncbi:hypothetical protein [Mucilaginibacter ginsenosidivorax]|uniref:Lipoprotein n=1 Tax=Mucilaginibacter ginsenosidivorax TaxID=862126 RepID=A0A5B8VW42_9SPHI|nr:hypothetical protein [Mucilaginibacter ginsenosidivorax]QEC75493.1 hypothetical protein FSB76_05870 [Mucilaginibacter ginsenosidivorax]